MPQPRRRDDDFPEPPRLRRLRLLVTVLILVLIGGVVTVVAALVINLSALTGTEAGPAPTAETLALPAGEEIVTVGEGRGRLLIVTRDEGGAERLHAFDAASGERVSTTRIERD